MEKTWNAIEFILDRLAESNRIPWVGPLTEGEKTGVSFHYGDCWYRKPAEVKQIADTLRALSKEEFKKGYTPDLMAKCSVYPDIGIVKKNGKRTSSTSGNGTRGWRIFIRMRPPRAKGCFCISADGGITKRL